jgi:ABC transporter substrate binding protein
MTTAWRPITTVVALLFLVVAPLASWAQQTGKVWRIGFLSLNSDIEPYKRWHVAFREELRKLGYVEGDNVIIDQRYAAGQVERLSTLAAELVRLNVDVLVTAPAGSAAVAKKVTSTIPIVFIGEPDPVGTALVASLGRPGGNVTGLADAHADLVPKRLELLKQMAPSASRVAILWNPANPSTAPPPADRGALDQAPTPDVRLAQRMGGGWLADVVRDRFRRPVSSRCAPRGQDPQRCQACRSSRRTAHEVRVGGQHENREGTRPEGAAIPAGARGSGHRVTTDCPASRGGRPRAPVPPRRPR